MTWLILLIGIAAMFGGGGWARLRAIREFKTMGRVSPLTAAVSMAAYTALAFCIVLLTIRSAWPIGLYPVAMRSIGSAVLAVGIILYCSSRIQFRSLRRTWGLTLDHLVTGGAYRLSRHPQGIGMFFLLMGTALWGRSEAALILAGVYAVATGIWLAGEEAILERQFGQEYRDYRARVPKYFGFTRGPRI
jgi:protein-S-isoprenylcysteine O-methyltransferase Ste14